MTTPINSLPSPTSSSPNNPPIHFTALNNQLDSRLVPRFSTVTARNSAITAPVEGMVCTVAGYSMIYRAGSWHGIGSVVYIASSVDTTVYTSSHTVMTLSVPDPQFSYKLEVYGSVLMAQIGIGVSLRGIMRVNGTNLRPKGTLFANTTGSTITSGVLITSGGPGVSATLTGASTVDFLINKEAGVAGNGFQAQGGVDEFWVLSAKVLPV